MIQALMSCILSLFLNCRQLAGYEGNVDLTSHLLICGWGLFCMQDCTIRSCDFDTEQTCVLHSPEKRTEQISIDTEVHLALTPLQPVVFFGFHKKMSVTG